MRSEKRVRGRTKMFGILVALLALVIAAYVGFMLAFVDDIPAGAWVGFGIVIVVAFGLSGVAAALVFETDKPTVRPRAPREGDGVTRLLVVANETIGAKELRTHICDRTAGCESHVLVVVPALNTPLRHWFNDDGRAQAEAERRLDDELRLLGELGVKARGRIGPDDPLQAIDDALQLFPADEIVIATHPRGRSNWLEADVVSRAHDAYGLPVTHVVAGERVGETR